MPGFRFLPLLVRLGSFATSQSLNSVIKRFDSKWLTALKTLVNADSCRFPREFVNTLCASTVWAEWNVWPKCGFKIRERCPFIVKILGVWDRI